MMKMDCRGLGRQARMSPVAGSALSLSTGESRSGQLNVQFRTELVLPPNVAGLAN